MHLKYFMLVVISKKKLVNLHWQHCSLQTNSVLTSETHVIYVNDLDTCIPSLTFSGNKSVMPVIYNLIKKKMKRQTMVMSELQEVWPSLCAT
jgi:hypothetical protein